jgi:hypothetical protein
MNSFWITSFIETFINKGNGWQSYELESNEQTEFYQPIIVQVGVGAGDDTCELTQVVKQKYDGKLFAIDWFQGNISTPSGEDIDAHNYTEDDTKIDVRYQEVLNKIKKVGKISFPPYDALKTTTLIKGNSHEELEKFEDNSIDVLFIDGGHEYSVVKKDIEIGWNKVKPGGYICGDDYSGDYHLNNIDKVSKEDLEKDTIDGKSFVKMKDNNGFLLSVPNIHAGVIKAVYDFFNGEASVNHMGRYWFIKK